MIFQLTIAAFSIVLFDVAPAVALVITLVVFILYNYFSQKISNRANKKANESEIRK
jgi:Ca2+/Na+ antiporter